jgi:hypothetical protein
MQNKTGARLDLFDRNKSRSLQKVYDPSDSGKPSNSRIFEVPAFMFSHREDANQLRKVTLETLNAFRPKLEARFHKGLSTADKGGRAKQPGNERVK